MLGEWQRRTWEFFGEPFSFSVLGALIARLKAS